MQLFQAWSVLFISLPPLFVTSGIAPRGLYRKSKIVFFLKGGDFFWKILVVPSPIIVMNLSRIWERRYPVKENHTNSMVQTNILLLYYVLTFIK